MRSRGRLQETADIKSDGAHSDAERNRRRLAPRRWSHALQDECPLGGQPFGGASHLRRLEIPESCRPRAHPAEEAKREWETGRLPLRHAKPPRANPFLPRLLQGR